MDFLLQHFKDLTTTPANVQELKKLVLQLAVQGKLTAQWRAKNPDSEPASVLLERIKAEKERMVKAGEIKRDKPIPKITEQEKVFELPQNWKWVRLANYGLTNTGTTPSKDFPDYFGNYYSFVKPAEILVKAINYNTADGLSLLGIKKGRLIPNNSVLMVCIGGSIGKSYYTDREVSCNQQINTITPLTKISAQLTNCFLQTDYFQNEVWGRASGATTPIINKGKWERIAIPLPPLAEQEIIVAKVNQLLTWCDELEEKIAQRDDYRRRLMQAACRGQNS